MKSTRAAFPTNLRPATLLAPSVAAAALLAAFVFAARPATAQARLEVEVTPRAGFVAGRGEIGRAVALENGWFIDVEELRAVWALGAGMRVGRAGSPWRLTGSILRSQRDEVPATLDHCADLEPGVVCVLVLYRATVSTALTTATIGAEYAPLEGAPVLPFATVAVGMKAHGWAWEGSSRHGYAAGSRSHINPALALGFGAEWPWSHGAVRIELTDVAGWMTGAGSGVTHDTSLTVGARLRVH